MISTSEKLNGKTLYYQLSFCHNSMVSSNSCLHYNAVDSQNYDGTRQRFCHSFKYFLW